LWRRGGARPPQPGAASSLTVPTAVQPEQPGLHLYHPARRASPRGSFPEATATPPTPPRPDVRPSLLFLFSTAPHLTPDGGPAQALLGSASYAFRRRGDGESFGGAAAPRRRALASFDGVRGERGSPPADCSRSGGSRSTQSTPTPVSRALLDAAAKTAPLPAVAAGVSGAGGAERIRGGATSRGGLPGRQFRRSAEFVKRPRAPDPESTHCAAAPLPPAADRSADAPRSPSAFPVRRTEGDAAQRGAGEMEASSPAVLRE